MYRVERAAIYAYLLSVLQRDRKRCFKNKIGTFFDVYKNRITETPVCFFHLYSLTETRENKVVRRAGRNQFIFLFGHKHIFCDFCSLVQSLQIDRYIVIIPQCRFCLKCMEVFQETIKKN